jgi:FKBP-type peptidyl-prolyl cis-trans isomerase
MFVVMGRPQVAWLLLVVCLFGAVSSAAAGAAATKTASKDEADGVGGGVNFASAADVVLNVKHRLGRIKSALDGDDLERAMRLIKGGQKFLGKWGLHVQRSKEARDNPEAAAAEVIREEPVPFDIKITHVPKRCKNRKTAEGDTLKVHFVGKLLSGGKKAKAFDSSFHTGSMPYRFVLGTGGGAKVEGWNEGLLGMCEGERRTLTIPWTKGFGEEGRPASGIPPFANLKYMIELVEFRGGGGGKRRRRGDL